MAVMNKLVKLFTFDTGVKYSETSFKRMCCATQNKMMLLLLSLFSVLWLSTLEKVKLIFTHIHSFTHPHTVLPCLLSNPLIHIHSVTWSLSSPLTHTLIHHHLLSVTILHTYTNTHKQMYKGQDYSGSFNTNTHTPHSDLQSPTGVTFTASAVGSDWNCGWGTSSMFLHNLSHHITGNREDRSSLSATAPSYCSVSYQSLLQIKWQQFCWWWKIDFAYLKCK